MLLVFVVSGQTYYLDREHSRGDLGCPGLINWVDIQDTASLKTRLSELEIDCVFFGETALRRSTDPNQIAHLACFVFLRHFCLNSYCFKRVFVRVFV